jgi:hypothetical protein
MFMSRSRSPRTAIDHGDQREGASKRHSRGNTSHTRNKQLKEEWLCVDHSMKVMACLPKVGMRRAIGPDTRAFSRLRESLHGAAQMRTGNWQ